MKHIKNISHTKMDYLNLDNIFLLGEHTNLENIYLNFLCITSFWLSMKKTFSRPLQFNPMCTRYNFLFHVGFINTLSSNKILLRNIHILFTIGWLVQKVIKKFIKAIDATIMQDTRRYAISNPSLKKYHQREWRLLSVQLNWI